MKYCSACGQPVTTMVPDGDNRPRSVCTACAAVHYVNPKIVAGCVPELDGQILLCRRAIPPRLGFWTVPAGFMELGESVSEAVVDVVHAGQVHVFFSGQLLGPDFGAGVETLETRLFSPEEIPWSELAFPSIRLALEQHLENGRSGNVQVRLCVAPRLNLGTPRA